MTPATECPCCRAPLTLEVERDNHLCVDCAHDRYAASISVSVHPVFAPLLATVRPA